MESGAMFWLTTPRLHGSRTFGTRDQAQTFDTEAGAKAAILELIDAEDCRGLHFSVATVE